MMKLKIEEQPVTLYNYLAWGKGFNTLEEVATCYNLDYNKLKEDVGARKRTNPKNITGSVKVLRSIHVLTAKDGTEYTAKQLAEETGVDLRTIQKRIQRGKTVEEILATPVQKHEKKVFNVDGKRYDSLESLARAYSMNSLLLRTRILNGMTAEQAVHTPVKETGRDSFYCLGKMYKNVYEVCIDHNVPKQTVYAALKRYKDKTLDEIILKLTNNPVYQYLVYEVGYETLAKISRTYDVDYAKFYSRIRSGKYETYEDVLESLGAKKAV